MAKRFAHTANPHEEPFQRRLIKAEPLRRRGKNCKYNNDNDERWKRKRIPRTIKVPPPEHIPTDPGKLQNKMKFQFILFPVAESTTRNNISYIIVMSSAFFHHHHHEAFFSRLSFCSDENQFYESFLLLLLSSALLCPRRRNALVSSSQALSAM